MRILFLLIVLVTSTKCFAQSSVIMPLGEWNPAHNIYLPYFPKTVTVDTNTRFKPYLIEKEVTSNYTLTEHDNGTFIYVTATANITIPLFKVPFTCTVLIIKPAKVTFKGAVWRSGLTPLSNTIDYMQFLTIKALPNRTAIIN